MGEDAENMHMQCATKLVAELQSNAVERPCLTEICEVSEQSEGRDCINYLES